MNHKQLYILLDSDQDIVETFPENSNFDYMFQRKQAVCPYGTLHKATIILGPEQHERIQTKHKTIKLASFIITLLLSFIITYLLSFIITFLLLAFIVTKFH